MKRLLMVPFLVGLILLALSSASAAFAQETTEAPAARIVVVDLRADPQEVELGQDVAVTAEVRNIGDAQGSETLQLLLDGALVQTITVTLDPGQSQSVAFTRLGRDGGTHVVALGNALARFSVGSAPEPKFRQGPVVRLRPLNDEINSDQDGLVEMFVSNSSVNDIGLMTEVFISVPSGIHVYGESFGQAAAAGTVRGLFEMPPGSSRTIPIYIKAEKTGRFFVHFSGHYWPEGNKDAFQPISLTAPITVSAISLEPLSAAPTSPEQVLQANDSPVAAAGSGAAETVAGDTPWFREPLFFVIVALVGATLIVYLGKTVITMSRD